MPFTAQQVIDLARIPLNDARKARYTDARLLQFVNSAVLRIYELRPDLFIGTGWTGPSALSLSSNFPLPDRFAQDVADYVAGRAEIADDDAASMQRANMLMQMFTQGMTT